MDEIKLPPRQLLRLGSGAVKVTTRVATGVVSGVATGFIATGIATGASASNAASEMVSRLRHPTRRSADTISAPVNIVRALSAPVEERLRSASPSPPSSIKSAPATISEPPQRVVRFQDIPPPRRSRSVLVASPTHQPKRTLVRAPRAREIQPPQPPQSFLMRAFLVIQAFLIHIETLILYHLFVKHFF